MTSDAADSCPEALRDAIEEIRARGPDYQPRKRKRSSRYSRSNYAKPLYRWVDGVEYFCDMYGRWAPVDEGSTEEEDEDEDEEPVRKKARTRPAARTESKTSRESRVQVRHEEEEEETELDVKPMSKDPRTGSKSRPSDRRKEDIQREEEEEETELDDKIKSKTPTPRSKPQHFELRREEKEKTEKTKPSKRVRPSWNHPEPTKKRYSRSDYAKPLYRWVNGVEYFCDAHGLWSPVEEETSEEDEVVEKMEVVKQPPLKRKQVKDVKRKPLKAPLGRVCPAVIFMQCMKKGFARWEALYRARRRLPVNMRRLRSEVGIEERRNLRFDDGEEQEEEEVMQMDRLCRKLFAEGDKLESVRGWVNDCIEARGENLWEEEG